MDTRHVARGLRELPPAVRPSRPRRRVGVHRRAVPRSGIRDQGRCDDPRPGAHHLRRARARGRRRDLPANLRAARVLGRSAPCSCAATARTGEPRCTSTASLAGGHGSGATSFDVDITPFLRPAANDARHHPDRVHAVCGPRRHELVRPHVAARDLARHVPVRRPDAPPRPARPRRGLGSGPRTRGRSVSGWTSSTSTPGGRTYQLEVTVRDGAGGAIHRLEPRRVDRRRDERAAGVRDRAARRRAPGRRRSPACTTSRSCSTADGGAAQAYRRRIGFRRVETRGNQLLVNGVADPRPRRQSPRLADPQGPGALRGGHARGRRQPAPGERQRHPDLALSAEPASARRLRRGRHVRVRAAADLLLGRVRRPSLDAHERGGPAGPVSCWT